MITDCPVDDVTLCEFALDLEDALNADTIGFITERLASEERPCQDVFHDAGEDVGCTDPQATSLPVVTLLRFQGDCCSTLVENFEPQLVEWINENANQDTWRLYALVPNAPTWEGGSEILLVRGGDDDAPTIGIGTNRDEQHVSIPGAIIGARNALFIGQDEELLPWR